MTILKFKSSQTQALPASPSAGGGGLQISYDRSAFDGAGPSEGLRAQFPEINFIEREGPPRVLSPGGAIAIATADGASPPEVEAVCAALRQSPHANRMIVFLKNAELSVVRRVLREGAADVLPAPVSDAGLAASLERVLARLGAEAAEPQSASTVVAMLKAGGGVGTTALATQLAASMAAGGKGLRVCLVDLDVQFGLAGMYLDLPSSVSLAQVISAEANLAEMTFSSLLKPHASGARVLAAPPEFMPLEALNQNTVDGLISALRREFDFIILDLPVAWTAWTYRALRQADRIVMVTQLTVPHAHLAKRQLRLLETQRLGDVPVTLVCNRCGGDNPTGVSVKSVERAIGRDFDQVIPEDRKLMNEAINQGVALSAVKRGSKLEKAIGELAKRLVPAQVGKTGARGI